MSTPGGIPKTISQLPAFSNALGSSIVPVTQGSVTGSLTLTQIIASYPASIAIVGNETITNLVGGTGTTLQSTNVAGFITQATASASIVGTELILQSPATNSVKKTTIGQLITQASNSANPSGTDLTAVSQSGTYAKAALSQITDFKTVYTDTGAANAYVVTPSPAYTAYFTGMELFVNIAHANALGTSTINVNGLGTKNILNLGSNTPLPGQLPVGHIAHLVYNGVSFTLINPARTFNGIYAPVNAVQSLTSGTDVAVIFGTPTYDTMNFHSGSTYSLVTIPSGYGITNIRLTATLTYAVAAGGGLVFVKIYKNGVDQAIGSTALNQTANQGVSSNYTSPVLQTTAGDTWAIDARQSSGGTINLNSGWFNLEVVL